MSRRRAVALVLGASVAWYAAASAAEPLKVEQITGVVVDNNAAELTGDWSKSNRTPPFVGEGYIFAPQNVEAKATYKLTLPQEGIYQVLISYSTGGNRSEKALVRIHAEGGPQEIRVNQQKPAAGAGLFHALGEFTFPTEQAVVEISSEGAEKGVVIADAVRILTADQFAAAQKDEPQGKIVAAAAKPNTPNPTPAKEEKPAPAPPETAPAFARAKPERAVKTLTSSDLDALLAKHVGPVAAGDQADDIAFLRRLTLDIIGRLPTRTEIQTFTQDAAADKRSQAVERLLKSPEFGLNYARYWSDVISYRTPQPELTFLNYQPLQQWMAERFNEGRGWDQLTYELLTATGKVGDNPAASFVGFHQADKSRLAAETTRVFLSTQIQCAECHDHKFVEMPQETFHHLAAFFVRVEAKLPWNDSSAIVVSSKPKGEHRIPGGKEDIAPAAFGKQDKVGLGDSDMARRAALARWIVGAENPWFAKAFVNRVWARMMGRGFCEPVDEIGELGDRVLPEVHTAVADHFIASEFDPRGVLRLIANTRAYQRAVRDAASDERPFATMMAGRLRGDEIFDSLVTAIDLPNVTPEAQKPTAEIRFPPPPKSTRDLVNDAFGFDPSLGQESVVRSLQQAMFLMNNRQVQKQVDASPSSETMLAKLLAAESDDAVAITQLYERVLARAPNERELEIAKRHVQKVGQRATAYEDLLWSLLNSAEFSSRR